MHSPLIGMRRALLMRGCFVRERICCMFGDGWRCWRRAIGRGGDNRLHDRRGIRRFRSVGCKRDLVRGASAGAFGMATADSSTSSRVCTSHGTGFAAAASRLFNRIRSGARRCLRRWRDECEQCDVGALPDTLQQSVSDRDGRVRPAIAKCGLACLIEAQCREVGDGFGLHGCEQAARPHCWRRVADLPM